MSPETAGAESRPDIRAEQEPPASRPNATATSAVQVTCVDYSPGQVSVQEINDVSEFISRHRPDWSAVRWINVAGLSDMNIIHVLAAKYDLHPLVVEDLLNTRHRPKIEAYGGDGIAQRARLFIVTHTLRYDNKRLYSEQISMFLGHTTLLTFQESANDIWKPVLQRIHNKNSRVRNNDASFLVYTLLDTLLDDCFPIMERFGDRLEDLETEIIEGPPRKTVTNDIHNFKRDLLLMRWVAWPMREVVAALQRESHECLSENTRIYMRDLTDHIVQLIEIIETYRERASDMTENYMSAVSHRMNEVMKVLTIIGTIFIPLTFLAGVYGMNFHYFPELDQPWAYPAFWVFCGAAVIAMVTLFRRRGWL